MKNTKFLNLLLGLFLVAILFSCNKESDSIAVPDNVSWQDVTKKIQELESKRQTTLSKIEKLPTKK